MNPGIIIALVGLAVIAGTRYVSALDRAQTELSVIPKVLLHSANVKGVTMEIQLTVKNPTNATFSVQYPYFNVTYRGTPVVSSDPIDKKFPVKANGTSQVNGIYLTAEYGKLIWTGVELAKAISSGEKVTLQVETLSTVYTAAGQMPFKQTDELVLQR